MKVIFEDNENALASRLFRAAYRDTSNFIYVRGSSSIAGVVESIQKQDSTENIYIYFDIVPSNRELRGVYYDDLLPLANGNKHVIIFPIPCSEYYVLKAFADRTDPDISTCINKGNYFNTKAFQEAPKKCKSFEKFCKYLLKSNVKDCLSTDSRRDKTQKGHSDKKDRHPLYEAFYTKDCPCNLAMPDCVEKSLLQKSVELLSQYECVPSGSIGSIKRSLIDTELQDIHRQMVDEFNAFSDMLKALDTRADRKYFYLKYIDFSSEKLN